MKKAIIAIGVPGSGKTTIAKEFAKKNGYEYIDFDEVKITNPELVELLLENPTAIWDFIRSKGKNLLDEGRTVVFDATFAGYTFRSKFVRFLRESGAEKIQAIYVNPPVEVAIKRAQERTERIVDEESIRKSKEFLDGHPPSITDGFELGGIDGIFELDQNLELIKANTLSIDGNGALLELKKEREVGNESKKTIRSEIKLF